MNKVLALILAGSIASLSQVTMAMVAVAERPVVDNADEIVTVKRPRVFIDEEDRRAFYRQPAHDRGFYGQEMPWYPRAHYNGNPGRFVMLVEAYPDRYGAPGELKRIVGFHRLENNAAADNFMAKATDGNKQLKKDDKAEQALSFCDGLKCLGEGLCKAALGGGIIIVSVAHTGAPYVVDMFNKIAKPLSATLYKKIIG